MTRYLRLQGSQAKVNDQIMPGLLQRIEIDGELRVEQIPREGRSGQDYEISGYSDANFTLYLSLLPPDIPGQVRRLQRAFEVTRTLPQRYMRVVHPVLDARGIKKAIFRRLTTREIDGSEEVEATLEFTQFGPDVAIREERSGDGSSGAPGTQDSSGKGGDKGKGKQPQAKPETPAFLKGFVDGSNLANRLTGGGP